jgi:hypothetical protein
MSHEGIIVKSADFLHNMRDTFERSQQEGDGWFNKLGGIPKDKRLKYWSLRLKEMQKAWPENPLLPELDDILNLLHK